VTVSEWTCPTCRTTLATQFCPQCGERPIQPTDFSLKVLIGKLAHALTSVDSRLLRTLNRLLRQPGALTVAYVHGPRKPYVAPFQLFLFANVVFFAVQSLSSTNIFGATLDSNLHSQDWSNIAQSLVGQRLEARHLSFESFAPLFDRGAALHAKSLIILMAVAFSLALPLVFLGGKQTFMTHVAFSLHLYTFLLFVFSVSLLVAVFDVLLGGKGLQSARMDNALSLINFTACAVYLFYSIRPVYGSGWPTRAIKAVALTALVSALVLAYRFTIFLVTLYTT
jgi:Protein of unknown function (DUF3667)